MEHGPADPRPIVDVCREWVHDCDLVVLVVAFRRGWVPDAAKGGDGASSITALEIAEADRLQRPVLAFFADDHWPGKLWDDDEEARAWVKRFRANLNRTAKFFSWEADPKLPSFRALISQELANYRTRLNIGSASGGPRGAPSLAQEVPGTYRAWVLRQYGGIDLLGLKLRKARPPSLASIYVPQTTLMSERVPWQGKMPSGEIYLDMEGRGHDVDRRVAVLNALAKKSLFVSGAPGTGKSTFCRRVACLVAEGATETSGAFPPEFVEVFDEGLKGRLPLFVKLRELTDYLPAKHALTPADVQDAVDAWVTSKQPDGLNAALLQAHVARGSALIILDGMDEVPVSQTNAALTWHPRAQLIAVLGDVAPRWIKAGNRLLVTSRPYGLTSEEARHLQLEAAPLQPLPLELQRELVRRWFSALAPESGTDATTADDLFVNIEAQPWLVELAANPLLLTAMCIVFDEGKRLPQDKHELYERVVATVLFSRYPDPADIDRVKRELGVIAYGMHTGLEVDRDRATPKPEATFYEVECWLEAYRKDQAKSFLQAQVSPFESRERLLSNSGLFLSTGDSRAGFAHFSFQDFFAAQRALDVDETSLPAFFQDRAKAPEWRNALSFLFGRMAGVFTEPKKAIDLLESCLRRATVDEPGLPLALWDAVAILTGKKIALKPETLGVLKALLIGSMNGAAPIAVRAEAASALGRIGDPRFHDARLWCLPNDPMLGFIEVPAGPFRMGSNPGRDAHARKDEQPQHEVDLPQYFVARYPVTVAQFRAFVDDTAFEVGDPDCLRGVPNHPVAWVSWHEALAYCEWLTKKLRASDDTPEMLRTKLANGWVVTLPSEAEWEKAARGTDGRVYPWKGGFDAGRANGSDAGLNSTSAVGLFAPGASPCGAQDMSGNVWEWTRSLWGKDVISPSYRYSYDPTDPERENVEAENDVLRVVRGGSFSDDAVFLRAALRYRYFPVNRFVNVGFRVVSRSRS